MRLELMLNRTSHEQSTVSDDVAFNGWLHGPASGDDTEEEFRLPILSLRPETWGGVLVYGPTGQVFAADSEAYALLEKLKNGSTVNDLSQSAEGDITAFLQLLDANNIRI